jgi:hypothetical protein
MEIIFTFDLILDSWRKQNERECTIFNFNVHSIRALIMSADDIKQISVLKPATLL